MTGQVGQAARTAVGVEEAIAALDLAGKVELLTGAAMFALRPAPAIGLAEVRMSDGPAGVRGPRIDAGRVSCLLPSPTLVAAHWDAAVAARAGELLAEEARAQGVSVLLGPTVNLHRGPLGGRLFEAFSEDPLLTGALAVGYTRGLQSHGVAATVKHFVGNESETDRATVDCRIGERALREIYLMPFQILVEDANPWAVMAAYNRVDGAPATEHAALVNGVLKGEWGYDGLVMSDWFAARSTVASANAGLDLVMPGPDGPWGPRLVAAVRAGEVAEATVDEHLRRLLRLASRVGAFGVPRGRPVAPVAADSAPRRAQLRRLAAAGMTVLVNRDHTLPLASGGEADGAGAGRAGESGRGPGRGLGAVAVIGRHAIDTIAQGGGSAELRPPHVVSVADGLRDALGADRVQVVDGVEVRDRPSATPPTAVRDPDNGRPGVRAVARDAAGAILGVRHLDATELVVGGGGWADGAVVVELTAEVAIDLPTRMRVGVRGVGAWTLDVAGRRHSVSLAGADDPGEAVLVPPAWTTEVALAPGARLTGAVTLTGLARLGLIAEPAPRPAAEAIAAAERAARAADLAVLVVGLTEEQETECRDKATLRLPGEQDAMVAAVAAVARRTVVVVNAATPVLMPWLDQAHAVLWAGLPGQEAGDAVAAALLGLIEPAGRLPTTFPARDGDGPAWSTTPRDGALDYAEGVAVGHRGWARPGSPTPLFWFGHGLGYATWEYGPAELDLDDAGMARRVRVELTNTGRRSSREVVQAYLRPASADEPTRLIGWAGAVLDPGQTMTVEAPCDARVQRRWDVAARAWAPLSPGGQVLLARGLGDVRATLPVPPALPEPTR